MTTNRKTTEQAASAPTIEGVAGVEIKVTIRPDQELQGLRALQLDEDSAEVRMIYFYDTAGLDLYNAGVVLRWKTKHKDFPYEFSSEEWRLPNGEDLLEVSIKVKPDEATAARQAFESHLRELGLDPAGAQETKTRTALEYFTKALTGMK